MKVLSLFDWISCGMIALERAWIDVDTYYASEIDSNAIAVSKSNYPNIIQLWDITKIKWEDMWNIDLIIWWSPCQSFSTAWKQQWFEWKSWLFREYIRLLKEIKPKYFLLENVKMKQERKDIITNTLKEIYPNVQLYNINSSLVSAQLRNRFYWTNIQWVELPSDKWIRLKDILEYGYTDRDKSRAILESESRPLVNKDKILHRYINTWFTTVIFKDKELSDFAKEKIKNRLNWKEWVCYNYFNDSVKNEKSWTIIANWWRSWKSTTLVIENNDIRYFTQTELERLQTLPVWYTSCLNRNKAAWVIWNWRTVDVISHIFSYLEKQYE